VNENGAKASKRVLVMKRLFLTTFIVSAAISLQAGGWGWGVGLAFSGSSCAPQYGASYSYSPGGGYGYTGPSYAVGGMLLGALTGGIIGNSIHHQGWEGAAIGAASGLVLGSVAENYARAPRQTYQTYPAQPYQPNTAPQAANPTATFSKAEYSRPAYAIPNAPTIPDAPLLQNNTPYKPVSAKSSAKSLSGR
jgi:YMGG-like Gly-zipper